MACRSCLIILACLSLAASGFGATLAPGSSAIVSQGSGLRINGQPPVAVEAGQSVTVLGLKTDSKEAVVSFTDSNGKKLVGILPISILVAVDAAVPAISSTQAPVAVALDTTKFLPPEQIAQCFKLDKNQAKSYVGQRMKFTGVIDRVEIEIATGGTGNVPVLTLETKPEFPKLKVRLASSVASGDAYFRKYSNNLPSWWWGYHNRQIEFRLANMNCIEARAVYNYGSINRNNSRGNWFPIFMVGDPISLEAQCRGLYMDVEFEAGLIADETSSP